MYLKRLELQGFKSFPEKVRLEFNQGVTAVVGPNGSGKSNVSDAIRWVLGEQRPKSLRGDKMEDVIFAGTENRKPLGFAEVSITIDNQDEKLPLEFTEIQVTRRVFRSGESEYRINGAACRLKDIQELFMDTGIGREGYSIIGQGRIDELLSAKGDERRKIFEEAAGIVKYKTRRNEAINKLEKEQQNLIRVDDIISELEIQLAPLEEQSARAKEYLSLKDSLKQVEVIYYARQLERVENQSVQLEQKKKEADEEIEGRIRISEEHKLKARSMREKTEELDALLQALNDTLAECREDKERKEGEIRLAEEQRQNDISNALRMEDEISQKQDRKRENDNQLALCQSRITALKMEIDRQQEKLTELEKTYGRLNDTLKQGEDRAESFKDEIFEQVRMGTEAKGEIAKKEAVRDQFMSRREQLQAEKSHLQGRIHQYEVHLQALEKQEADTIEEISFLEKELNILEQDRQRSQGDIRRSGDALAVKEKELSELMSRLSVLQEMERDNEGFYLSVKSLLNLPDREKRGICGAVGQLLQVEKSYEVAIEATLGGAIQNVVTRTEENARDAINFLKEKNLGRATFLPVSAVKGRGIEGRPSILDEKGVIGIAHELVEFDPVYRDIMISLLGRTLIVENLDQAVLLAKKYKHQYRIVTLEGDILNPGGAMTGGSRQKKGTHIFSRGREIRELREKLSITKTFADKMRESYQLAKEDLNEIEEQIVEKRVEQQRLTASVHSNDGDKNSTLKELEDGKERLRLTELEEEQLLKQLEHTREDIKRFEDVLSESEKNMEKANLLLSQFQDTLVEDKDKREAVAEEITQLKIAISKDGQGILSVEETIMRLKEENDSLTREIKTAHDAIGAFKERGRDKEKIQENLQLETKELNSKIESLQEQLQKTAAEKTEAGKAAEDSEAKAEEEKEAGRQMENELIRLEARKEKLEEEKIQVTTQLWEEYEMTCRMAAEFAAQSPKPPQGSPSVRELRGKIRALGDVNVQAIEQFKEVKGRYGFLTAQRDDIIEAEKKLEGIIDELSLLMESQFREQFDIISENFDRVFKEMFGGGKAYLKLTDRDNVLESPIEIVAQPPGKNLQNMQLLSGGERALTAIAILFSILYMKPSPFCILDEIEAALDDANVTRFAKYLKNFSKETQFIVITHRKGTMEYADVMYGVTMQEKGISKLISVDFTHGQAG